MKTTTWLLGFLLALTGFSSCNKEIYPLSERFDLCVISDTIQSYPGGGGVFVAYITTGNDFQGSTQITVDSDKGLNAEISKEQLNEGDTVFELVVKPDEKLKLRNYSLQLKAINNGEYRQLDLVVSLVDNGTNAEDATGKLNAFKDWLIELNPQYGSAIESDYFLYRTYQVLVVEHYTVLTPDYEIRFCYHVMIPPHDWSMIRIRKRNFIEPEFCARRETDGTIQEIPISEYPILFGY